MVLQNLLIGSLGVGVVTTPILGMALIDSTFINGEGILSGRAAYIISKSNNGNVKLFAEEESQSILEDSSSQENKTYKIKALYNQKEVKGELSLCSPNHNKSNFYLLFKPNGEWWVKKLNGEEVICNSIREQESYKLGERLELKIEDLTLKKQLPKEISLNKCSIEDLRLGKQGNWQIGNPLLEIICSEPQGKKVKIFSQSFEKL